MPHKNATDTPLEGVSSYNQLHAHTYVIDADGNGTAYQKCHPDFPTICHSHKIKNFHVESAHSKDIDILNGAPWHDHELPPFVASPALGNMVYMQKQQYYDEDGDSLFDSILPKVFVSKVVLENSDTPVSSQFPKSENPHIKPGATYEGQGYVIDSPFDPSWKDKPSMSAEITLNFKEKIKDGNKSLFLYDEFKGNLKLRVVVSKNKTMTNLIAKAGYANMDYQPSNDLAKFLSGYSKGNADYALSEVVKGATTEGPIPGLEGVTIQDSKVLDYDLLSTVQQFNSLFDMSDDLSGEDAFIANINKNKEVLANGDIIHNISFKVPEKIIFDQASGGVDAQHFAIFAVVYIDPDGLMESLDPIITEGKLEDLGYDLDQETIGDAKESLQQVLANVGLGRPAQNVIIQAGSTMDTETIFLTSINEQWFGDYYMSPYGQYFKGNDIIQEPTPEDFLYPVTMNSSVDVIDYRVITEMEKHFFNYSDFGTGLDFYDLIEDPITSYSQQGEGGLAQNVQKQTISNSSIKLEKESSFSEPVFAMHGNGTNSFMFSLDVEKLFKYNSPLPGLSAVLDNDTYADMLSRFRILDLKIYRRRVKDSKIDGKNNNTQTNFDYDENEVPMLIVQTSDLDDSAVLISKYSTILDDADAPTLATGKGLITGEIREINLLSPNQVSAINSQHLRHFTVTDTNIRFKDDGLYKYSIEMEFYDPVLEWLNSKLFVMDSSISVFEEYYQFSKSKLEYYNSSADKFTIEFWDAFTKKYDVTMAAGTNLYSGAPFGALAEAFNTISSLNSNQNSQKIKALIKILKLARPESGNPTGVEAVLKMLETSRYHLNNLINMIAATNNFKNTEYKENTIKESIGKSSTAAKNTFKLSHEFKNTADSGPDAKSGYEYVIDEVNTKLTASPGLEVVDQEKFFVRYMQEAARFGMSNIESFPWKNPLIQIPIVQNHKPSFLSPRQIKLTNSSQSPYPTTKKPALTNQLDDDLFAAGQFSPAQNFLSDTESETITKLMLDVMRFNNREEDIHDKADNSIYMKAEPLPGSHLKDDVANMLQLPADAGITFERGNSNRAFDLNKKSIAPDFTTGLEDDQITEEWGKSVKEIFGPVVKNADISTLVMSIVMMEYLNYIRQTSGETYTSTLTGVTQTKEIDLEYYVALAQNHLLAAAPNQIKAFANYLLTIVSKSLTQTESIDPASTALGKADIEFSRVDKFLSFMMNFRNLVRVEYFTGFGASYSKPGVNLKNPNWSLLTENKLSEMPGISAQNQNGLPLLLIRLRPYDGSLNVSNTQPEILKLPIFNRHFFIRIKPSDEPGTNWVTTEMPDDDAHQELIPPPPPPTSSDEYDETGHEPITAGSKDPGLSTPDPERAPGSDQPIGPLEKQSSRMAGPGPEPFRSTSNLMTKQQLYSARNNPFDGLSRNASKERQAMERTGMSPSVYRGQPLDSQTAAATSAPPAGTGAPPPAPMPPITMPTFGGKY